MTVARLMVVSCALLAPLLACGKKEEYKARSFAYYQPILDRMPFGAPPPEVPPELSAEQAKDAAQVQAEQQKLAKQINMSCINVTPGGATAIGFTDLNEKPPLNFYLLVGATGGGWKVLDANYDEEWAQIEKDGVTITLKLGKGLIDGPPTATAVPPPPTVQVDQKSGSLADAPAELPPGLVRASTHQGGPPPDLLGIKRTPDTQKLRADIEKFRSEHLGGSYAERLRERMESEKKQAAATEQLTHKKVIELARQITQEELAKKQALQQSADEGLIAEEPAPVTDQILNQTRNTP